MTCMVQILIYTTVNSKNSLPTLKLKNKSETDLSFLGLTDSDKTQDSKSLNVC